MRHPCSFEGIYIPLVERGAVPAGPVSSTGRLGAPRDPAFGHYDPASWEPAVRPANKLAGTKARPERVEPGSTEITAVKRRKARRSALWAGGPFR